MKNGVEIMIRKTGEVFLTQYENDNFMGEIHLNNEEKAYIEKFRDKIRKLIFENRKRNQPQANQQQMNIYTKKMNLLQHVIYLEKKRFNEFN